MGEAPQPLPNLVRREAWGAVLPEGTQPLGCPVPFIVLSYTGTPTCQSVDECSKVVRNMQTYHMTQLNMPDIRYNFLIGGDGNVYEGRGWTTYAPLALKCNRRRKLALDNRSINIAMIGDFVFDPENEEEEVPGIMVEAGKDLIKYGKLNGYILISASMWRGSTEEELRV